MKDTQTDEVLKWLKTVGPLTPLEALRHLSCFRLGARIHDLKKRGVNIQTELVTVKNQDGKEARIARYSLAA